MESQVVENKGLPGNGLTDSVAPEEGEPLRSSNSKRNKNKHKNNRHKEQISLTAKKAGMAGDDESGDEENGGVRGRANNRLEACAKKCQLTPKRALIYLLFTSFVIFLLLLILIVLAALWPDSPYVPTCQTAQCHAYSGKILQSLNASTEPCHDVWEFACGGWLQNSPIPESRAYWDANLQHELQLKDKVRTLLNTLPTETLEEAHGVYGKMKRFYDSCMSLEYIEADSNKPLQRIIKNLGGWHVLRDFRQNDFNFNRVMKKLHGEHRVSPFFEISVVPDPRVPSRNIIQISPGGLSLANRKYYFEDNKVAEAFKFHVKDMVQILGANSVNAQQFASELFNYEKRIAEISPNPESLLDPVETFQKVTVYELKGMSSTIFWPDLLKSIFPRRNIIDQTEVLVLSRDYLIDISNIISSTDRQTLNNYLMWQLTKKYLPYLSEEFAESYDMFLREISGRRRQLPRWEFCIDNTMHYFRHATDFLLSQNLPDRTDKLDKVTDIFESIRHSIVNRINEATTKYDESMRNFLLDKMRLLLVHVGTPFQNGTALKEFYMTLDVQKSEWFTNIRTAIEFEGHLDQTALTSTAREAPIMQILQQTPNRIRFLPTSNTVIVPESVLQRDVMKLGLNHLPLLLGSVGVEMGGAIAQAFGIELGLYGSGGHLMSNKDEKVQTIRDLIDQRRTCLVSFFVNIKLDDKEYVERTSLDTTIHLAGIQVALEALENHDLASTFLGLPALENLPPNALFFLSYVQSQCSAQTLLYHDMEHFAFTSLSHEHRTKGLLRQMVAFSDALECPSSSELYADFSCGTII